MSYENNAEMTAMMTGTVIDGTGTAARMEGRPVAGKTGTSQDYRDAWFVGFTADYVCGVWIGNDDDAPMRRATGGGLPARIFKTFMTTAEKDLPPRPLAGTEIALQLAAAEDENAPAVESTEPPSPQRTDGDLLDAFQNLLNKLF
jgi:penicillin-binding protein 1A